MGRASEHFSNNGASSCVAAGARLEAKALHSSCGVVYAFVMLPDMGVRAMIIGINTEV